MVNITTSIPRFWHDMARKKGIKWSFALITGIKTLMGVHDDDTDAVSRSNRLIEVNRKLEKKLQEANDVLEKTGKIGSKL